MLPTTGKVDPASELPTSNQATAGEVVLSDESSKAVVEPTDNPWKLEGTDQRHLHIPRQGALHTSLDTTSNLSYASITEEHGVESLDQNLHPTPTTNALSSTFGAQRTRFWEHNKGVVFMVLAQFFAGSMATIARLLQTDESNGPPMSTFQILFVRMGITMLASLAYMWLAKIPDAPLGIKEIRPMLALRGFGGFFGVFGLYYSLIYLPLAEAIVITFLGPMVAAWAGTFAAKIPFTRSQQLGGLLSILGVILIAKPFSLIASLNSPQPDRHGNTTVSSDTTTSVAYASNIIDEITPAQRAFAVAVSLLGVCGSACAYTTIAYIGKRAHPLISVNYFASWTTFVSFMALLFLPGAGFRMPATTREWILMFFLGITGFVMQFLLTAGLAHKKSNRVLNMVYTQMLFALAFDKIIWNENPDLISWLGSLLILGSVIWVAMRRDGENMKDKRETERDEETGLLVGEGLEGEEQALLAERTVRE